MRKIYFLLLTVFIGISVLNAQVSNYSFSGFTASYVPLTGATNSTAAGDDGSQTGIPLGFSFNYGGLTYSTIGVSTNGYAFFGALPSFSYTNSLSTGLLVLAPLWDDNNLGSGSIRYVTTGSAGSRVFTIEWVNINVGGGGSSTNPTISMQLRLFEGTNVIQFIYGPTSAALSSTTASIGISGSVAGNFLSVTPLLPAATSTVSSVTENSTISSAANFPSGTIYSFTPPPACTAPTAHPVSLALVPSSTSISGSFPAAAGSPTGYLIVRTTTPTPPTNPVDGTTYTSGTNALNGFIVQQSASTTFLSTGLQPSTTYYYFIFPYNSAGCLGGPLYRTPSPNYPGATTTACTPLAAGTYSVGPTGSYASLTAVAAAIANGTAGASVFELQPTYNSSVETYPIVFSSGSCPLTGGITIRPQSGATALSITGSNATTLIDLNNVSNLTIDGRPGGIGTASQLRVSNTALGSASAVRFINDASNNTLNYLTLQGSATTSLGVVSFAGGIITGNDNNTISNSSIGPAGTNLPLNGIYSMGASENVNNSGNTLDNNNIFDVFNSGSSSSFININSFNSGWNISNNRLYQTAARTATSAFTSSGIFITSGTGYSIIGNTIGYANASGTGTTSYSSSVALRIVGINASFDTGAPASGIQGNSVSAISLGTSSGASTLNGVLCGININSGDVNIGTVTGNIIGASSGAAGALSAIPTTTQGAVVGINCSSTGVVSIQNNTIGSMTSAGTTAAVAGAVFGINISGITTSLNISNNTIGNAAANNMRAGVSGTTTGSSLCGGINLSSTPLSAIIANNTIQNFSSYGTGTSGYVRGIFTRTTATDATSFTITGNTISNLTTTGALSGIASGLTAAVGIHMLSASQALLSENTIFNVGVSNTTATTNVIAAGIVVASSSLTSALGTTVSRNRIYGITNTTIGTTLTGPPISAGIAIRSGNATTRIENNMISLGNGQSTNTSFIGIWGNLASSPSPSVNIYNNSVVISGTATSGALPSFGFMRGDFSSTALGIAVDLRNNIFSNTRSGGTGSHYAIANNFGATATSFGWTSNYNVLNTTSASTVGYWTSAQPIAGWRTASNSDANSLTNIPLVFANSATGDLHLNFGTTPTQLESGGIPVGITTDYDGQARPGPVGSVNGGAVAPDFGADEFDGVILDVIPPTISYTPLPFTCSAGARTLTVSITDVSGVPTTGTGLPVLYWRINSGAYSAATATYVSGNIYSFSFGAGTASGDVVSYFIVARDNAATPNIAAFPSSGASGFTATPPAATTPPTTPSTYSINGTLSGVYTVGATGTYPTITAAVQDYNSKCLTGPVTFSLIDATYSASETFPITINQNPTASATNTLTIKPASGVSSTISGLAATNFIFVLNGADFITFDGSNTTGGITRDLTIKNINTTTNGVAVLFVLSQGTGAVGVLGAPYPAGAVNNTVRNCIIEGPGQGSSSLLSWGMYVGANGSSNGPDNDNLTIQNNQFRKAYYGIQAIGSSTAKLDGLLISGNEFGSANTGDYLGQSGLILGQFDGGVINGNTIYNIISSTNVNPTGISLSTGSINSTINGNTIRSIRYTGSGGYGGKGMDINTGTATSNLTISNNIISDILGDGWSTLLGDAIVGIRIGATAGSNVITGGIKLYHNSVNLGSGSFTGSSSGTQSAALYLSATTSGLDIRNNIFATSLNNSNVTSAKSWAINSAAASTAFVSIDNNNYSVNGSQGVLSFLGSDRTTLSALQSAFGGNANSRNSQPTFVSATDLRLQAAAGQNWSFESAGTPISSVTSDIDGDTRNASIPDIGADEFTASSFIVTNPAAVCAPNTVDITAAAVTAGTTSGTTFTYWTDAAGTITLTNAAAVATSGTYYIKATFGSADNFWIKPVIVVVNPQPTPVITGPNVICVPNADVTYSVANVAGNTYNWTVTGGTITAGQGTNSITVTWGAAGTATVTVTETTTATGCVQTATSSITLNPNPTPVITGLAAVCTTNEGYVYSVPSVAGNTYAWSVGGGTITAGAGTNAITVTWGAVGAGSVTVTQTVTATGCATTVSRATNIQTLPTATATVVEPVTCASEDGQINLTLGGAAGPYTFAWTGTGNGLSATTQNQPVVSTGFYNVTVTAANGCTTSLTNVVVSGPGGCFICPTIGTITSTATIICQDGANTITAGGLADLGITYGIRFKYSATPLANPYLSTAGTVMGTVSNANLTVVGGTTTSTSASINYNFPTAGTMYVYAILSPASPDPACRPFLMIPVEVAPTPVLTRPADQVRCTGSATAAVNFLAAPATTTTFAWTNNRTSIGLAASGTGNIASFTATNFTNAPVTALITVTPTNTQTLGASTVVCPGPAQTYSYTINPIPTVNTVTNQSVCAGTTVSLPFSGFVTGTVYEWTNSNTAIGLAATGTGTLSYTATNNTSSPITATIIVTPKFTSAGGTCTGNPISFEITVNPTPVVDAIPAQVLCSGSATTAISLTSATTGTAFSWTNSATSVGLAGTGTGTSIASFTAVNTGAAPVNAIISITPSYTGAGFTCTGSVGTTTITVNPIPATTGIADRVICNGAATTFTLTGPVTAAVYNWTNSNTGIGLAGTGSGTIAFTASNTTGAPITSTIEVTPSITNAGLACVGGTSSFTVTVNPSGQVNAIDNQVLCNGSATSAVTFSTVNNGLISTGGSQVASSGTISVAVPDASAVGATHTIPVTLPTGAVITNMRVTMNLTHTWISDMIINLRAPNGQVLNLFNGHGGSGDNLVNTIISSTGTASLASGTAPFTGTFAATAAIGVGPTGNASTAANFAALYSTANGNWILSMRDLELGDLGTLTGWSIAFDYVVQGQFGTNMNWTNSLSSIGLAATGTGNIPSFTAANTTADPVVSTVTVTPSYFNAGTSCAGAPVTFTYTVNPTPTVNTVANQVFCTGTPSTVNFSGATTGTVFNWTSSNAAIGLATSGSGNLSFTPTNTSNVPIVSTITVTPVFTNGGVTCTGTPRTFTITVNPVGQVNTVLNQVLCNGAATTAVNFATVNGGGTVQVGTPVTANSGAITVAIPDASAAGTTHSLPVTLPAGATITGVSVSFNMTHTWVGDVVVNLRAPNGQVLNLVNRRGGSGDNFVNTTISSASTTSLATGTAPFTGTFAADAAPTVGPTGFEATATNFAALYSVANGNWTLGMRDYAAGDNGTLTGWSITFNYTTVAGAVTTYNWTNTTPSIGLAASGVGNIASFAAANTSTVPVTATVSVTPTYTNAGVGCAGPASSFTYTVNPTPTVNAVSNQAVCRGSNVAAISFGGTVSGTVYNWTNTNTAIGLAASGTGDIASFVGANTTSAPISGTITVTPVFTNAGITCTGTPRTFTITVNPIPTVNSVASFPVCHNSVAAVTFSGATTGTVYNWTNTNTTIGLPASGTGNLNFTALNTTSAPTVATITVTPVFTNGGTACTGTPISFTITVNPLPVVSAGTLPARICISDTLVPLNGTPVGGSWSGIGTSGMNFVPTATAVGTWPITYTFSDINGCTNRATIAATVLSCDERDRDLDNSAVLLYPNPNSGQFNLRINSTRFNALGMRVFNTAGQLVSTKQWSGLVYARVVPVNLTNLPAGIYMVRLYYGDGMDRGADKTYQIIIAR